ncbi:PREDICTED: tetraspanin-12 [Tarenaya hassleriana]|uniref:tetraspanin-12 n=1 Tax=Tarenaya hassleriana TaxID=28532 RepID=UPI00053CA5E8|nr:PREDICTED: tetraspanin-12 [Tarenaya hassleriana]
MLRLSNAVVITVNALLAVAGLTAVGFSVYVFIHGPSQCQRFIQNPLIVTATLIFFVSSLGLIAALYGSHVIMTLYLIVLFLAILFLIVFTVFVFLVTNHSAGEAFSGKGVGRVKTANLENWVRDHLLRGKNWDGIRRCLSESRVCKSFGGHRVDFYSNHLSSVQFGCCRPPAECGFQSVNATWWTPAPPPRMADAENGDCKAWSNVQNQLCFGCESCKIGVLSEFQRDWKSLLVFNSCLLLLVVLLYSFGCCARRNNKVPWKRRFV